VTEQWNDIPGVTAWGGQPRLPARPRVVIETLAAALIAAANGGITLVQLVTKVHERTGEPLARLRGLAGWLPTSRVAAWDDVTGKLLVQSGIDLQDLAMRYAAWAASQPVPPDQVDAVEEYVRAIIQDALTAAPHMPTRASHPARPEPSAPAASAAPETPAEVPLVPTGLAERIRAILDALDAAFLERRTHVRASLLAILSGQHVLMLGPPGTAKSMLARALCACFRDATYFEYLLSKFTHPDELFGPVSIPGLKEEDYRRLTEGFLPQAHVAFLDEIFKANSAILNSLLTLINERVFHHGRHRDPVPLIGLIGASNELPDPEGGLAALYDRFLVRLAVPPLGDASAFLDVATGQVPGMAIPEEARLTRDDLRVLAAAAERIEVPDRVQEVLVALWRAARRQDWEVSDRRWRQAVAMLKVGVAADGRRAIDLLDLLLLQPILAPTPEQMPEVRDTILEHLGRGAVPQHDLRAQWILLNQDKVAPTPGHSLPRAPSGPHTWTDRLARRRGSTDRFLALHAEAVQRLASDRSTLEHQADRHLWIDALPVQVLSAHIEAARDLARILEIAESYRARLENGATVAAALVASLPERARHVYGHDLACTLMIAGTEQRAGLTLAGERVPSDRFADRMKSTSDMTGENVVVEVRPDHFLDWVGGDVDTQALLKDVPAWASRNARTALESARRLMGGLIVPSPPELPQP